MKENRGGGGDENILNFTLDNTPIGVLDWNGKFIDIDEFSKNFNNYINIAPNDDDNPAYKFVYNESMSFNNYDVIHTADRAIMIYQAHDKFEHVKYDEDIKGYYFERIDIGGDGGQTGK